MKLTVWGGERVGLRVKGETHFGSASQRIFIATITICTAMVTCHTVFVVWKKLRGERPLSTIPRNHRGVALTNRSAEQDLLIQLRRFFDAHFSEDELRTVCFDLGIEYDNLAGVGKAGKARELVACYKRYGRLSELMGVAQRLRPNVSWADAADFSMSS